MSWIDDLKKKALEEARQKAEEMKVFFSAGKNKAVEAINKGAEWGVKNIPNPDETIGKWMANAPKFNFAEKMKDDTIGQKAVKFGATLGQETLNIPSKLVRNFGQTALDSKEGELFTAQGARQFAGRTGENILDVVSLGKGKALATAGQTAFTKGVPMFKQALQRGAKQGFKVGAGYGTGYGVATEAQKENTTLGSMAVSGAQGGLMGGLTGGVLGGTIPAVASFPGAIRGSMRNRVPGAIKTDVIPQHTTNRVIQVPVKRTPNGDSMVFPNLGKNEGYVSHPSFFTEKGKLFAKKDVAGAIPEQRIERGRAPSFSDWMKGTREALPRPGMTVIEAKPNAKGEYPVGSYSALWDKKPRVEISDKGAKFEQIKRPNEKSSALLDLMDKSEKELEQYIKLEGFNGTSKQYREELGKRYYKELYSADKPFKLDDVLKHEKLFKKYPYLRDMNVSLKDGMNKTGASFNKEEGISIGRDVKDVKSSLLHEIQHSIQQRNGWARGGSPENIKTDILDELYGRKVNGEKFPIMELRERAFSDLEQSKEILNKFDTIPKEDIATIEKVIGNKEKIQKKVKMLSQALGFDNKSAFDSYRALAGELEARSTQRRMNMSPSELLQSSPYTAEAKASGIKGIDDVITRYGEGRNMSVAKSSDDLVREARKYKTEEEFLKAQGETLYHGTQKNFDSFDIEHSGTRNINDPGYAGKGIYVTNAKEVAEIFSKGNDIYGSAKGTIPGKGRIIKAIIDKNANILEVKSFPEIGEKLGIEGYGKNDGRGLTININEKAPLVREKALALGYDGIKVDGGGFAKNGNRAFELVIFNNDKIKTKSQLSSIYKQANETPQVTQEVPKVTPLQKIFEKKPKQKELLEIFKKKQSLQAQKQAIKNDFINSEEGMKFDMNYRAKEEVAEPYNKDILQGIKNSPYFKKEGQVKDIMGEGFLMDKNGKKIVVPSADVPKYQARGYQRGMEIDTYAQEEGFDRGEDFLNATLERASKEQKSYGTELKKTLVDTRKEYADITEEIEKVKQDLSGMSKTSAVGVGKALEREKLQGEIRYVKTRRDKVRAIQKFFGLSDNDMKRVGTRDFRLMNDGQFNQYLSGVEKRAGEEAKRLQATAQVVSQIQQKELQKVDNLRQALKLPTLDKMTTDDLRKFDDTLSQYKQGDEFLSVRKLETVDNTDLKGIRTTREANERLSSEIKKKYGVNFEPVKVLESDKFRYDTALAERNPFYKLMVDEVNAKELEATARTLDIEKNLNALLKDARKNQSTMSKLIPQDKKIFAYLEGSDKATLAKDMTPEELKSAEYIRQIYAEMRDYLAQNKVMENFRENYITHTRKGFLETAKDDGLGNAFKNVFQQNKQDEAVFNILAGDTQDVLPLEKFFQFSLRRTGELSPTQNVGKAVMSYVKAFEKKRALDQIIPKMSIYTQSLSPTKKTPLGLEYDQSLKKFVNEWINNKKGRRTDFGGKIPQGGKIDTTINAIRTFTSAMDLGFSLPVGVAARFGERSMNFISLGAKKFAVGQYRAGTKTGQAIAKKYDNFIGRNPWTEFADASDDIGDKMSKAMYVLFRDASYRANKQYLLANLTENEFKSGVISPERLAVIKREMGRFRTTEGSNSIVGSTSAGKIFTQYKTWAVPILRTTSKNLSTIAQKMRTNPKEAFKSQEMAETVRSAILTGTVVLIGGAVLDSNKKESDKTFVEKIAGKVYRDSLSLIGALDPTFWFGTPRTADFLLDISSAMKSLAMLETYKQDGADYLEGELKGANKLKKSLTPSLVKQVIGNDSLTSRESEKMKALPNEEKGLYKEAIEEKNKIEKEKANGKEDMQSVYQEIKKLKQKGRMDEARALYDSLDKNQLESIKTVITAEKAKVTKQKTEKMYGTVIKIKKLKKEGKMEEARAVFDSVPEEEREYLLKAAKQLSK